jgi:hypothetical protein
MDKHRNRAGQVEQELEHENEKEYIEKLLSP